MSMSIKVSKDYLDLLQIREDLNKPRGDALDIGMTTALHEKQVEALASIFKDQKKLVFAACGRKFGKTQLAAYALWKWAMENPGSACYYIAPEASHGRKIIWDVNRLQNFLGKDKGKYIERVRDREMMVRLKNGSFIQIVGSENYAAANGLTPAFVVYDEFKAFHPRFHIEMDPNRAAQAAPLLIIGTQPTVGDKNKEQYEGLLEFATGHQKDCAIYTYGTFDNPINMRPDRKKAIEQQISILRARGDEDVVQREYFSKIISAGSKAIFPMFSEKDMVKPHHEIIKELSRDMSSLEWVLAADPGTTTCFAALLVAINPVNKKVYVVDEIYEKNQEYTSASRIWPRMEEMILKIYPNVDIHHDVGKVADEAAAWFIREVLDQFRVNISPTQKHVNKKDDGLSLMKDIMIHDLLVVSDNCKGFTKEVKEYAKDRNGRIPKANDHAIDTFRYALSYVFYNIVEALRIKNKVNNPIYNGIWEEEAEEQEIFPVNADLDFDFFD